MYKSINSWVYRYTFYIYIHTIRLFRVTYANIFTENIIIRRTKLSGANLFVRFRISRNSPTFRDYSTNLIHNPSPSRSGRFLVRGVIITNPFRRPDDTNDKSTVFRSCGIYHGLVLTQIRAIGIDFSFYVSKFKTRLRTNKNYEKMSPGNVLLIISRLGSILWTMNVRRTRSVRVVDGVMRSLKSVRTFAKFGQRVRKPSVSVVPPYGSIRKIKSVKSRVLKRN